MSDENIDILLLDGDCGLCNRLARFIDSNIGFDKKIKFHPIESDFSQKFIKTFPTHQQEQDTVYLYRNNISYTKSSAAIRCLLYLKWYWRIWFPFLWLIPLPLRNIIYQIVAKYRHYIFSKPKVCFIQND